MARNTQFSLENLRQLDFGKIGLAFQAEVERVVKDCLDRPGDEHARSVILRFNFAPVSAVQMGAVDCDTIKVEGEITSAVPKRRTRIYEMTPTRGGQLKFNPDLPGEPSEATIFEDQEIEEDKE